MIKKLPQSEHALQEFAFEWVSPHLLISEKELTINKFSNIKAKIHQALLSQFSFLAEFVTEMCKSKSKISKMAEF